MDRSPPRSQAPADALGAQVPAARRPRTFPAITAKPRISGSPCQPGTDSQGWAEPACLDAALQRARAGDEMAFRALYRDVHPRVLRYLQAVVGADAEDVASETWFQVARDLPGFQGDGDGFRGWAATVARNRATDHLHRARRRPRPAATVTVADLETWAASDDTAGQALELMATDAALALISQLPGDQAEAVLLRVVMGLDAVTAGRVLGKRPLRRLPVSVLAKLPASVQARLPAPIRARLAATELARVPAPALAGLPVSVLALLPAPVLASLPAAVRSLLPPALLATMPNGL